MELIYKPASTVFQGGNLACETTSSELRYMVCIVTLKVSGELIYKPASRVF